MPNGSPNVDHLLSTTATHLPLSKAELRPAANACKLRLQDAASLFPGARHGEAALAGLLLRLGCWAESHTVAQDVNSAEGSYWHAIVHRIEPDSANAGYWFRQTGKHPIFADLRDRAEGILAGCGPAQWRLKTDWDPMLFIRWCDEARERRGAAERTAILIQAAEWELLFNWCAIAGRSAARGDEA